MRRLRHGRRRTRFFSACLPRLAFDASNIALSAGKQSGAPSQPATCRRIRPIVDSLDAESAGSVCLLEALGNMNRARLDGRYSAAVPRLAFEADKELHVLL